MNPLTQTQSRLNTLAWPFVLVFTALTYVFLYAFVHESGHALVGIAFGQRLVAFQANIFTMDAYVSLTGSLTPLQRTIQSAAGHGLPLLLWAIFMLLAPRRGDVVLRLLKVVSSVSMLASTAVWVIIPILYLQGQAPAGDDVTHILNVSGISPLLLAGISALILVLGVLLAVYKNQGLLGDLRRFADLRQKGTLNEVIGEALPRSRKTLAGLASLGALALLLLVGLQAVLPGRAAQGDPAIIPPGYRLTASFDLSQADSQNQVLAEFRLEEPASAGIFVQVHQIETEFIELSVAGPGDFRHILMRALGMQATLSSASFDEPLPAGEYQIVLSHQRSPGRVEIYLAER